MDLHMSMQRYIHMQLQLTAAPTQSLLFMDYWRSIFILTQVYSHLNKNYGKRMSLSCLLRFIDLIRESYFMN